MCEQKNEKGPKFTGKTQVNNDSIWKEKNLNTILHEIISSPKILVKQVFDESNQVLDQMSQRNFSNFDSYGDPTRRISSLVMTQQGSR